VVRRLGMPVPTTPSPARRPIVPAPPGRAALGVEVVEQQLLIDARPACRLFDARTREAALGKLFAAAAKIRNACHYLA